MSHKAVVETVPHPRRKNATPLLGKVLTYRCYVPDVSKS